MGRRVICMSYSRKYLHILQSLEHCGPCGMDCVCGVGHICASVKFRSQSPIKAPHSNEKYSLAALLIVCIWVSVRFANQLDEKKKTA